MINKVCRETRREIDECEMHQALSETAAAHVQLCAGCRAFCEQRTRLRDLVGSLEPVTAPADFDFRLRARMAAHRAESRRGLFMRFGVRVPATIAAAVLLMIVGSIVWMNQRTGIQSPPVAQTGQSNNQAANVPAVPASAASTTPKGADRNNSSSEAVAQNPNVPIGRRSMKSSRTRGGHSSDFNEIAAQPIRATEDPGSVSLSAPVRPLVVSMEDDRGTTRTISLPPVSFGSQRLVDNRIPVSQTGNRIW